MATKAEIIEMKEERAYWKAIGEPYGWQLYGWNGKVSASFIKDGAMFEVGSHIAAALSKSSSV